MKSIILTKKHKEKLLEMCKALYPEYDEFYFYHEDQYKPYNETWIIFCKNYKKDKIVGHEIHHRKGQTKGIPDQIHWYELCVNHLIDKLYSKSNFDYKKLLNKKSNTHLVDYLYSKFKN